MLTKHPVQKGWRLFLLALAAYFVAYEYVYHPGGLLQKTAYYLLEHLSRTTDVSEIYNLPHYLLKLAQPLLAVAGVLALIEAHALGAIRKETIENAVILLILPFAAFGTYGGSPRWLLQNFGAEVMLGAVGAAGSALAPKFNRKLLLPAILLAAYAYAHGKNPAGFFVFGYAYGLAADFVFGSIKNSRLLQRAYAAGSRISSRDIFILIFILAALLRAWNIMGDLGFDHAFSDGYNAYAPYEIIQGKTIYRDFVYTHVPLLPYSIAAVYRLFGTGLLQARMFNLAVNLASIIPLYLLVKIWFGKNEALLASFFWAIYPHVITNARYVGHESLMTFFILISVLAVSGKKNSSNLLISGAALGLATLVKEPSLLLLIPFWFYLRGMGKKALPLVWGFLAVLVPILVYFSIIGGANFLPYNVKFHLSLPPQTTADKTYVFFTEVYSLDPDVLAGIMRGLLVIGFSSIGMYRLASRRRAVDVFMLVWLLSVLVLLLNSGFWWHYPLQLMPPFLLFVAVGILDTAKIYENRRHFVSLAAILMVAMLLQEDHAIITKKDTGQLLIAEKLKNVTRPDDLVLSAMLTIPLLAERNVPGELFEFGYQNKLLTNEYIIEIVDKNNVSAIIMDARVTDVERAKELGKFREYVNKNYRETARFDYTYWGKREISIWVRN